MTVCSTYFQGNLEFWISIIVSVLIITYLTLYLPITKFKSKWKYSFIALFLFLMLIAIPINILTLGTKDTCDGLWDRHYVKDYNHTVDSVEEANEIFRELIYEGFEEGLVYSDNETENEIWLERQLNRTRLNNDRYSICIAWNGYELHTNGELYSYWCGD